MRILVTGASGLVGGRLCEQLTSLHDVVGTVHRNAAPAAVRDVRLDLSDPIAIRELIDRERPDAAVHCAAIADSRICEQDPNAARRANVDASRLLATECRTRGIRLIACSTDLVLGGEDENSAEDASPAPLTVYGATKLEAERAILEEHPAALVLRLSLVCGRGFGPRASASEAIARALRRGELVTLYTDEWRTPLDADSFARAVERAIERPCVSGIMNLAGPERVSRFDFGLRIAAVLGLSPGGVRPGVRGDHNGVPRPRDVSLDITRARRDLDWEPDALGTSIARSRVV